MEELRHRRFVDGAFSAPASGDRPQFNIPAGSEISVVTADIQSGRNMVRFTMKNGKRYIEVDRTILLRATRA